jgi:hypothetical protein
MQQTLDLRLVRLVRLVLALAHRAAVWVDGQWVSDGAFLSLFGAVMPCQSVEACKLFATGVAFEGTEAFVQEHVPLAVVLPGKADLR